MLSIIIPVYNEVVTINEIINKLLLLDIEKEIIIIDDFSIDGTKNLLKKIESDTIKIFYNEKNYGKGYCIRRGIQVAKDYECLCGKYKRMKFKGITFARDTKTVPPIIENLPKVCIVVCMLFII